MNSIVVFYGMPGSYKTSIAHLLSSRLNTMYLSPSQYGRAHDEQGDIIQSMRLYRYRQLFNHIDLINKLPVDIIIDGCFDYEDSKRCLIKLFNKNITKEILYFKCVSSDIEKCKNRIKNRNNSKNYSDFVNPDQQNLLNLHSNDQIFEQYAQKHSIPMFIYDSCSRKFLKKENIKTCGYQHIKLKKIIMILKEKKYLL